MPTSKLSSSLVGKMVTMGWVSMDGSPQVRVARLETILREGRVLTQNEVSFYFGKEAVFKQHEKVKHDLYVFSVYFLPWLENGIHDPYNIIWSQKAWLKRGVKVKAYKP